MNRQTQALGRVDGRASMLPDLSLFIYAYVPKEAVLSSQIEGTRSSLSDLLIFENKDAPGVPIEDVQEVSNYVAALYHGLKRLREGFPLSLRLIREIHQVLLSGGRGSNKEPGEFRRSVPVQFESIHPFLDRNGRLGGLLITFLLCAGGALQDFDADHRKIEGLGRSAASVLRVFQYAQLHPILSIPTAAAQEPLRRQ